MQRAHLSPRPGVVLAVIYHTSTSLRHIPVGVRKSRILGPWPACLHTPVVRHARELAKDVPIPAIQLAMRVLVLLARRWDLPRIASVAATHPPSDARIPIMRKAGAVEKFAATSFHVENIHAPCPVTRAFVVHVRSRLTHVVIVAKCTQKCYVAPRMRSWTVRR